MVKAIVSVNPRASISRVPQGRGLVTTVQERVYATQRITNFHFLASSYAPIHHGISSPGLRQCYSQFITVRGIKAVSLRVVRLFVITAIKAKLVDLFANPHLLQYLPDGSTGAGASFILHSIYQIERPHRQLL